MDTRGLLAERLGPRSPLEEPGATVVIVPSLTFPESELRKIIGIEHYEERLLCLLLAIDRTDTRIVYVSSGAIDDVALDHLLSHARDPAGIRERTTLIAAGDLSQRPLTHKLLERPALTERIRNAIAGSPEAYLLTFNVSPAEAELARSLGVTLYGTAPHLIPLGSKSGARRVAQEAGVAIPRGAEDLRSLEEVNAVVHELADSERPPRSIVIKLNNGFSGQGNAIVRTAGLAARLEDSDVIFCASEESWPSYEGKIAEEGAVVEEIVGAGKGVSPSAQLRVLPDGTCELVSTHDQILGGPDGHVYLGCRFPARRAYRDAVRDNGLRIAKVLAERGVVGSFGIDFVVTPGGEVYLTEINLRFGGTTHPFLTARMVTGGALDPDTGQLLVDGEPRCYTGTDNLKSESYVGLRPADVLIALHEEGLAYDRPAARGVVLHMLGALPRYGKLGATCIARTYEAADAQLEALQDLLERMARARAV